MKYTKRFLALFLALCMMLTSVPLNVNAIEGTPSEVATEAPAQDDDQTVTEEETSVDDSEDEESEENSYEDVDAETEIEADTERENPEESDETSDEAKIAEDEDASTDTEAAEIGDGDTENADVEATVAEEETTENKPTVFAMRPPVKEQEEEAVPYADTTGVVDAAIFFSDLHSMYNGDDSEGSYGYKKDVVTKMMTTLKNTGLKFSSVTSVGDAFSSNERAYTGKTSVLTGYIRNALGNQEIPVNYTWSDHDRAALAENDKDLLENKSGLIYGAGKDGIYGNADDDNYYIYAISMSDTSSSERYNQPSTFTEQKLVDFKNAVGVLDNTKPLFIASHQPLLARRSDNQYAYQWCTAINEVAADRDVAFFFGHNHKYDQSGDYYCGKGQSMTVQNGNSTKNVTLNFTHMCAGYFNPVTTGSAGNSRQGTVMLVTIYDDEINYTTYSSSGEYTSSNAVNKTVTRDHVVEQVKEVKFEDNILTIQAKSLGLTAIKAENVTSEYGLDEHFTDYIVYDVKLEGHKDGNEVFYSILFLSDMDDTSVELYHVDDAGKMTAIPYEMVTDELGRRYLEFTTTYTGVFAYGAPGIPEGYTLSKLEVSNIEKTEYFVGDSPDLVSPIVKAIYSKEGSEDFTRIVDIKDDYVTTDGCTVSGYDMTKAGKQTVVISYGGLTCSFDIEVFGKSFRDEKTSVAIELTVPGVTGFIVNDSVNQYVKSALKGLVKENTFVAYDIEVNDYKTGDVVTVTMPIPEGIENPVVYYVSDSGKTAKNMNAVDNGNGTVSFETNHFSTYVLADGTKIELGNKGAEVESSTVTITKDIWVKVEAPVNNGKYMIVSTGTAKEIGYVMGNSTAVKPVEGTLNVNGTEGTYTYLEKATGIVWNASGSKESFSFQNADDDTYLGYTTTTSMGGTNYRLDAADSEEKTWILSGNNIYFETGSYRPRYHYIIGGGGSDWALGSSWSKPTSNNVYFYQKVTATETTGTEGGTYTVEGTDVTDAVAIANQAVELTSKLYWRGESETAASEVTNHGLTPTYEVVATKGTPGVIKSIEGTKAVLSGTPGTAVIKVTYTSGDLIAWDEFVITTNSPHHYGIQLHKAEMTRVDITEFKEGVIYYTYNSTTNTYQVANSYVEGTTYYTTPVIQGDEITAPVALKGIEAGDTYSVWAVVKAYASAEDKDGIELGTLGDALSWSVSDTSIANINTETGVITFTGNNYGTFIVTVSYEGADGKPITDTITISVTDSLYIVPGDGTDDFPEYPNEGSVRFDKTATAVGNFSETGIAKVELSMTGVPYTTNNRLDVVLMLDRSSSMYKSGVQHRILSTVEATKAFVKNIVMNEDGSFNNNRIMVMDFLGGNLDSSQGGGSNHKYQSNLYTTQEESGYQIINNQAELDALLDKIETDFKGQTSLYGTEYAQGLKGCYDALAASKNDGNKQFCVFMSDGIPNYMRCETTHFKKTADIVARFDVTNRTAANGTATRKAEKYEYEYYSTQMKNEGVTVFTVGLGLKNKNSAWSGTSKEVCEQVANMLLNDISGPAGETVAQRDTGNTISKLGTYFFSVADDNAAADMKNVFSGISQKIMEAAKDVVVEDKIGNNYSVNFALPKNVTADETDGISDFYIQAVEYQLNADKERTGEPAVLEKFTFNSNGSLKSHSVDGVACSNCNHVTFDDSGTVTAISGTYFDYKSDSTGEYLTWENEKIGTTELALQYFAHLDNSSDAVGTDGEIPAGTYYTNEYATLTYTNHNGNRVQEEFPIPQMTWNGAQVSYVFYLVNEAGQPVNRAGRVVPFAEAVYVTDVQTHHVIWNDLEQASALEAGYLAENIVPDVYALYDDDASYNIHVYEDEDQSNLNNHFVIGGDVTDEYNKKPSWNNANTTYVFNNKSDAFKYNAALAYIANDRNDANESKTYLCKGEGEVTSTISEAIGVTEDNFANKPYFTKINEKYTLAASFEAGVTYYEISSASYVPITDEEQWKPGTNDSTSGGTVINGYVYYIDENNQVYTIVQKDNGNEVREGFDFHNTTVAFAVVWKPQLEPDTVVVDYGLDVVVDVIANDAMAAGVTGVMLNAPNAEEDGTYDDPVGTDSITSTDGIWTARKENLNSVRFHLNNMKMGQPAEFYYEAGVNYYTYDANGENATLNKTNMYSSVTVIPATTVYYEDTEVFVTYTDSTVKADDATYLYGKWTVDGTENRSATQKQDRPGESKLSAALDANNIYGYDSTYLNSNTYSLGSAHKVTVSSAEATSWPTATFTFTGTAFDIISLTSKDTGTITVNVKSTDGTYEKNWFVDTYYGYTFVENKQAPYIEYTYTFGTDGTWHVSNSKEVTEKTATEGQMTAPASPVAGDKVVSYEPNGSWQVTDDTENSLYQIPVIKSPELVYDTYTVTITPRYANAFNHMDDSSYDFYLDAIRVYNPAKNSTVANDAYLKDGEAYPEIIEIRSNLLKQESFDTEDDNVTGAVFIDGFGIEGDIAEYAEYGPNNEVYLQKNQAIAFRLENKNAVNLVAAHLGAKAPMGGEASVTVTVINDNKEVLASKTINTESATELYYDITECVKGFDEETTVSNVIVIKNNNNPMVSLTNIKLTHDAVQRTGWSLRMSSRSAAVAADYVTASYIETVPVEEEIIVDTPSEEIPEDSKDSETVVPEDPADDKETGKTEDKPSGTDHDATTTTGSNKDVESQNKTEVLDDEKDVVIMDEVAEKEDVSEGDKEVTDNIDEIIVEGSSDNNKDASNGVGIGGVAVIAVSVVAVLIGVITFLRRKGFGGER